MTTQDIAAAHSERLSRCAELTFRQNISSGRHGWLRLTPAFSRKIAETILTGRDRCLNVFDPFSGTGTTALCAATLGHVAVAYDINPFLVWLGEVKVAGYDPKTLERVEAAGRLIQQGMDMNRFAPVDPPGIFNIERWWSPERLEFLRRLIGAINELAPGHGGERNLLLVAFCRSAIALSNAAFNHQSMSFRDAAPATRQARLPGYHAAHSYAQQFRRELSFVLTGAREEIRGRAIVRFADSKRVPAPFDDGADLLISSPPYPNRVSYVRELRPYMYWLGYIEDARQAGELDWQAIGGTWGIATSRVAHWVPSGDAYSPDYLQKALARIGTTDAKSGDVLARYIGKYFEDMWRHISSVVKIMNPGGEMHYIVGNSKFYDVVIPTEAIYRDMLIRAGASGVRVRPLRKRNSKKELVEFDVVAIL